MPYSRLQVILHWLVASLVLVQWLTYDAIVRTHNPMLGGRNGDLLEHAVHNYGGIAIGALVALRVVLRFVRRKKTSMQSHQWRSRVAAAVHWSLYGLLFAQALTGFAASYLTHAAAAVHAALWSLVWPIIGMHVAAAAFHLAHGDAVFFRMLPGLRRLR